MEFMGNLFTRPLEKREPGEKSEIGEFNMPVMVDIDKMEKSGSPKKYFFHEIGIHLAQAIADTDVPKEYWYIIFTPKVQREFNLPESTKMSQ